MIVRIIIFLVLNFGALAIGGIFTGKGVPSDWYAGLDKAPWTSPGWVFGFAWTTLMICFSLYMAYLWPAVPEARMLVVIFACQWILNVAWNPVFFYFHRTGAALMVILLLTVVVGYLLVHSWPAMGWKSALLLPYFLWLLVAVSLNGYVWMKN
ncbi:MAG TPA: tryptophan-rich sensory protein [Bacteroidales bacterium]|nr:tryptophan-rich sensory protein [Bacteroidales bacterium]